MPTSSLRKAYTQFSPHYYLEIVSRLWILRLEVCFWLASGYLVFYFAYYVCFLLSSFKSGAIAGLMLDLGLLEIV